MASNDPPAFSERTMSMAEPGMLFMGSVYPCAWMGDYKGRYSSPYISPAGDAQRGVFEILDQFYHRRPRPRRRPRHRHADPVLHQRKPSPHVRRRAVPGTAQGPHGEGGGVRAERQVPDPAVLGGAEGAVPGAGEGGVVGGDGGGGCEGRGGAGAGRARRV
ncbi:conserved hypothetical protein [Histoplasma capsulatum H143]|uniref:Uncharacterized protein n=1 Tax=Ajellomyces capsulatus (strain H143) TaxID=544712 RepID=C6HSR4_AJECH|nr:conserved hypothetical protein [Histoplasma capsulatum H143]